MLARGFVARSGALFSADDAEWDIARRVRWILLAIPFLLAAVGIAAVPFRPVFRFLANEDGVAEWGQFLCLAALVVLYARLAFVLWRRDQRLLAGLYALGAIGMVFIAGEEISWGQRVFGWATPPELESVNDQGESNLHNVGPVLKVVNIVTLTICFVAMVGPVLRWTRWGSLARSIGGYALIPPLALIPFFGFEFGYRATRLLFLPAPRYTLTKYSEFSELSFYLGLAIFAWLLLRVLRRDAPEEAPSPAQLRPSGG